MNAEAAWQRELEAPTEAFFDALAARVLSGGVQAAAREAIVHLVPRIHWAGYLPSMPHSLLGLWAAFRMEPWLTPARFHRLLAMQLHALAFERRGGGLAEVGRGSGHWGNLRLAFDCCESSLAWGEALGCTSPQARDFEQLAEWMSADMAYLGHKPVMARRMKELHGQLGGSSDVGRTLLAICAWLGASQPMDSYWQKRIQKRLGDSALLALEQGRLLDEPAVDTLVACVCDSGLVALLDALTGRVRNGVGQGDLELVLVRAACRKMLDARREMEGKTAWTLLHIAALPGASHGSRPEPWIQATALVNLFPSEDSPCLGPRMPRQPTSLRDAILDGEGAEAMFETERLFERSGAESVLRVLADAAAEGDPATNQAHNTLVVASAAEMLFRLSGRDQVVLWQVLAKSLAQTQVACEMGGRVEAALASSLGDF